MNRSRRKTAKSKCTPQVTGERAPNNGNGHPGDNEITSGNGNLKEEQQQNNNNRRDVRGSCVLMKRIKFTEKGRQVEKGAASVDVTTSKQDSAEKGSKTNRNSRENDIETVVTTRGSVKRLKTVENQAMDDESDEHDEVVSIHRPEPPRSAQNTRFRLSLKSRTSEASHTTPATSVSNESSNTSAEDPQLDSAQSSVEDSIDPVAITTVPTNLDKNPTRKINRCSVQLRRILTTKDNKAPLQQQKRIPKATSNITSTSYNAAQSKTMSGKPQTPTSPTTNRSVNNTSSKKELRATVASPVQCKSPDMFAGMESTNKDADIYAFHTQSSQSEHEDYAADVIEKMKKEGKIKMVKQRNKKAAKKSNIKPNTRPANWRNIAKNLSIANPGTINCNRMQSKKPALLATKQNQTTISIRLDDDDNDIDDGHFDDAHFDDDDPAPDNCTSPSKLKPDNRFSALAQNVLRKESNKRRASAQQQQQQHTKSITSQPRVLDKSKLLQNARNFVNTLNSASPRTPNKLLQSPLPRPQHKQSSTNNPAGRRQQIAPPQAASSPWRVDGDCAPRLFYFARTNDNLPSYSSDVVPSSQLTNTHVKRNNPSTNSTSSNSTTLSHSKTIDNSLEISTIQDISPIKSISSNHTMNLSNIENISPVRPIKDKLKQKDVFFGENPKRGLTERSPLKQINILNVITLPQRVKPIEKSLGNKENLSENTRMIFHASNVIENETWNNNTLKDHSDFFGFADDINEADNDIVEPLPKSKLPNKQRLHQKLIKLKRLIPPKPTRISAETIRSIFNSPKKQTDIREILSSTRHHQSSVADVGNQTTNLSAVQAIDSDEEEALSIMEITENETTTAGDVDVHLFDDPSEIQTSFNTTAQLRTYERPKRKKKTIHSFVMLNSDSESDVEKSPTKRKKNKKPDNKNKKELRNFIDEFNSMCDDVDQYELVVEKDNYQLF